MGTKPAQRAFLFLVLSLPKCGTRGHHPPDSARIREFRTLWTEIFLLPPGYSPITKQTLWLPILKTFELETKSLEPFHLMAIVPSLLVSSSDLAACSSVGFEITTPPE